MGIRIAGRTLLIASLVVLVADLFTLENRVVNTDPVMQAAGRAIGIVASGSLACGIALLVVGSMQRVARRPQFGDVPNASPRSDARPTAKTTRRPEAGQRFRRLKLFAGLLVLVWWFIGMPLYAYKTRASEIPACSTGPWIADAFLGAFAVAVQYSAPTPMLSLFGRQRSQESASC